VPSDNQIALNVLKAGQTGNAAVVSTAMGIAQYAGGAYWLYTGRAIAAISAVGSPSEKAKLATSVQQTVAGGQQSYIANAVDNSPIFTVPFWQRMGMGLVGVWCMGLGFVLLIRKPIESAVTDAHS